MTVLVLHGTWMPESVVGEPADGRFFVWAERVPAGRRGRRPAGGPKDGAPHPFQARPEEVRDAVVTLSPTLARQMERSTWRLIRQRIRLPSRDGSPVRSRTIARRLVNWEKTRALCPSSRTSASWGNSVSSLALDSDVRSLSTRPGWHAACRSRSRASSTSFVGSWACRHRSRVRGRNRPSSESLRRSLT